MFFCETGYFTVEVGANYECWNLLWFNAKIHVNQFNSIGGFKQGKTQGAVSGSS
jgi:imidazolonepropionase